MKQKTKIGIIIAVIALAAATCFVTVFAKETGIKKEEIQDAEVVQGTNTIVTEGVAEMPDGTEPGSRVSEKQENTELDVSDVVAGNNSQEELAAETDDEILYQNKNEYLEITIYKNGLMVYLPTEKAIQEYGSVSMYQPSGNPITKYQWYPYRDQIAHIVFGEGLATIAAGAFKCYPNLEIVDFPTTLERIKLESFDQCPKLREVNFPKECPNGLVIEEHAFRQTAIERLELPEGLTYIGPLAFNSISALTYVKIPDSLETIAW